jgi:hypothetical protein
MHKNARAARHSDNGAWRSSLAVSSASDIRRPFYARVEAVGLIFADAREINGLAWKSV